MKNKRSMLIISAMVLLLAVVLGMGGTTFARYITKGNANAQTTTATVAQWGWTVNVSDADLFGQKYDADGEVNASGTAVVKVSSAGNIIAPGVNGEIVFTVSGSAEVLTQITYEATGADIVMTYDTDKTYSPLKWTLKKGAETVDGCDGVALSTIVSKLNTFSEKVQAGQSGTNTGTYTLSYVWDFHTTDANDELDTILGKIAKGDTVSGYTVDPTTTTFALTITVAQVQS